MTLLKHITCGILAVILAIAGMMAAKKALNRRIDFDDYE